MSLVQLQYNTTSPRNSTTCTTMLLQPSFTPSISSLMTRSHVLLQAPSPLSMSIVAPDLGTNRALWIAGGEFFAKHAADSVLDIGRVRMRLEGLQAYATLCALLANGCLRLYSSVKIRKEPDQWMKRVYDAVYLFIVVSILSGSYTTVVFTLLALFSKTALGRGYDAQFLLFWAATANIRESAIIAFLSSLVCFELAFILSLYLRTEGRRRTILVLLACCMAAFSFSSWVKLLLLVHKFLFPLQAEVEY